MIEITYTWAVLSLIISWSFCGISYGFSKLYDSYKAWEDNGSDQIDIDKMILPR